jgi:hypothetical protein
VEGGPSLYPTGLKGLLLGPKNRPA